MNVGHAHVPHVRASLRVPILWGFFVGAINAAAPLGLAGLTPATVYAPVLAAIAAVYVGFAVADGRPRIIAVEVAVAAAFVLLASASVTGTAWLLVVGYAGHGLKDFWKARRQFVANTRWWPPFCAIVDMVVALVLIAEDRGGVDFHT